MVDPEVLSDLLERLKGETAELERLAARDKDEVLRTPDLIRSVKYGFVVAIEICIDIAHHVICSERLRAPKDYAEAFEILGEAEFVGAGLVSAFGDMARFRNLFVNGYARIDDARVAHVLATRLDDLDAFRRQIAAHALE